MCMTGSGPTFQVPSRDLESEPATFDYALTRRFRFDQPGRYTVKFTLKIGLDDETTQYDSPQTVRRNYVAVSREITFEVVAASAEWEAGVINRGLAAFHAE